jgi:hypothetical protein
MTRGFVLRQGRKIFRIEGGDVGIAAVLAAGGVIPAAGNTSLAAKKATTIAGLGTGAYDGQPGILIPSAVTDGDFIVLHWNSATSKWVGKPITLLTTLDQGYLGVNTSADWGYPSTNDGGATTTFGPGYCPRALPNVEKLLGAGCKLEHRWSGIIHGSSTPAAFTVIPFFFAHNSGDAVTFSANGSTAVAEGAQATSPGDATPVFAGSNGWQPVYKKGTVVQVAAAADVSSKSLLWPRFYGKVASGAGYGGLIDIGLEVRFTS